MSDTIEASAARLLERLLRRSGHDDVTPPDATEWPAFLQATEAVLADLQKDRYLLERALDTSATEMFDLNVGLRASAEQLAAEREELRNANSLLEATLESTSDGILVADGAGGIRSMNGRFIEMWGLPPDIVESRDDERAIGFVLGQLREPEAFVAKVRELYDRPDASSRDLLEFRDGRLIERNSLPQRLDGQIVGRVWSFRDVTEQQRLQDELVHQAFHDSLTGLANRALFADHVEQALKRSARSGGDVAVIVVDLDGFKTVNDSLGHVVGDALLAATADRFRATMREVDTIARLGGDEFALVIDGRITPELTARLGQRILDALAEPIGVGDRQVAVSASVGIAIARHEHATADSLLRNADAAMYRAKRDGKGRYRIFEAWMHSAAVELLELEQALRTAVADGGIAVHYQPVVDTDSGRVVSFEALARWHSPELGVITPDVFIPLAEESGLIVDLGRMVLDTACQQAKRWHDRYPDLLPGIAVNVSRRQLVDRNFPTDVAKALARSGLPPSSLTLEVTESALGSDPTRVVRVLRQLRDAGVRVAIDDFGTGYSSFAALADLPIDTLKIDKRFIDNLLRDGRGRGLVEAITQLARTLVLDTTAEGVELPEQQAALEALGCDRIQGYLYSRPLPEDETFDYLDAVDTAATATSTV